MGFEINPDFQTLIEARIAEPWSVPDWKDLDNLWAQKRTEPRRPVPDKAEDLIGDLFG